MVIIVVLVITGCVVAITYYLIQALKSMTNLTDSLEDTAQNIKNRLQLKALYFIPSLVAALIGRIFKRGR